MIATETIASGPVHFVKPFDPSGGTILSDQRLGI